MHPPGPDVGKDVTPDTKIFKEKWVSDQLSMEHPDARARCASFFNQVGTRYKNSKTIAGWIVGNEYGYLGLWSFRQEGYDPVTQTAFRNWLSTQYSADISKLNAAWGSTFASFDAVEMPINFSRDRADWADLIQFRKQSTGDFVAMSSEAVKKADPNHLVSYSKLGLVFGPVDWEYNAEDDVTIVNACRDRGYPLDFFSINNYASSAIGMEMRSGQWGIQLVMRTGLPILVTELGCTSTDIEFLDPTLNAGFSDQRQGDLIANQIINAMLTGAMGVHVFTWENRDYITTREYGFGIVNMDRTPKISFEHVARAYQILENLIQTDVGIFTSLKRDNYDAVFYWPNQIDSMHNRFVVEQGSLHGVMERIGLRVKYINETQLRSGQYNDIDLLVLPLNQRMQAGDMQYINDNMIANGVNVLANAVLPGYQDYHLNKNSDFDTYLDIVFGVRAKTIDTFDGNVENYCACEMKHTLIELQAKSDTQPLIKQGDFFYGVPWKYSTVEVTDGQMLYDMRIVDQTTERIPAVVMKAHDKAKALLFTYTMGEAYMTIDSHYTMLKALLLNNLGMTSRVQLSGSGMVTPFYYETNDNRAVLMVMNWNDYNSTTVTVSADFMKGKSIKDLRKDHMLVTGSSDGSLTVTLGQNEVKLFVIGESVKPAIGIDPIATTQQIMPNGQAVPVSVNYDTAGRGSCGVTIELRQKESNRVYTSVSTSVSGQGSTTLQIKAPDFSRFDTNYKPSSDNVHYYYRAVISQGGDQSEVTMPVFVEMIIPTSDLPVAFDKSTAVTTNVGWNYLPSLKYNAFKGLIVVYKSTKTMAVDSTHEAKVKSVANTLQILGYQNSPNLGAWDAMNNDKGPMYWIATDNVLTFDGSAPTSVDFLQRRVKVLILPGVSVLSNDEIANITQWVNTPGGYKTLITTESNVGSTSADPLASVFGVISGQKVGVSSATGINIVNATSPVVSLLGTSVPIALNGAVPGAGWNAVDKAYALAKYGTRPALIVNTYGGGRTFAFNFDITQLDTYEASLNIWRGVEEFAEVDPFVYKFKWEMRCGSDVVGSFESWVNNTWSYAYSPGGSSFTITPSASCAKASYAGYLYPYAGDYQKDAIAIYTSDNDIVDVSVSGGVKMIFSIVLLVVVLIVQIIA
jgi:hypothetical protein